MKRWEQMGGADWSRYPEAVAVCCTAERGSTSLVQRVLYIGYNQAARLVERMEEEGVLSVPDSNGARRFLRNPNIPTGDA